MSRPGTGWLLIVPLALGAGCSADRIERGVFHSAKGYRVALPADGWTVVRAGEADLELVRTSPPGGIAVAATCENPPLNRSLPLLARYLTFGLAERQTLERARAQVGEEAAERLVVRGRLDGADVMVEAVVARDARCVYDFLYVAAPPDFEAGRPAFRSVVDSFAAEAPGR
jgi:hypothetical protein